MAKRIFVGNLPFSATTKSELADQLSKFGTVKKISLESGKSPGTFGGKGIIEMGNDVDIEKVIKSLNGKMFMGNKLKADGFDLTDVGSDTMDKEQTEMF